MTPTQRKLARHALGLPNARKQSYRKHFVTGKGSTDWSHWSDMVEKGFARCRQNIEIYGGDDGFWLTPEGAALALDPGESLCPEDFPQGAVP